MAYSKQAIERAAQELHRRRKRAEETAQAHRDEVAQKIPGLREAQRQIMEAGMSVVTALGKGEDGAKIIERLHAQSKRAHEKRAALLLEHGYSENYIQEQYACPVCKDTGFVGMEMCKCYETLLKKYSYAQLCESSPLAASDFSAFSLAYYPDGRNESGVSPRERMGQILEYCKQYAADFSPKSDSLFFYGATGLGKTHLSLAIAGEVIGRGYHVVYDSVPNLLTKAENEKFGRESIDGEPTERMMASCDLLILDDLGAEFSTSYTVSVLYNLINTRLLQGGPVIISTNLTPAELEQKYTSRVTSRIIGNYKSFLFMGCDVRQLKKRER